MQCLLRLSTIYDRDVTGTVRAESRIGVPADARPQLLLVVENAYLLEDWFVPYFKMLSLWADLHILTSNFHARNSLFALLDESPSASDATTAKMVNLYAADNYAEGRTVRLRSLCESRRTLKRLARRPIDLLIITSTANPLENAAQRRLTRDGVPFVLVWPFGYPTTDWTSVPRIPGQHRGIGSRLRAMAGRLRRSVRYRMDTTQSVLWSALVSGSLTGHQPLFKPALGRAVPDMVLTSDNDDTSDWTNDYPQFRFSAASFALPEAGVRPKPDLDVLLCVLSDPPEPGLEDTYEQALVEELRSIASERGIIDIEIRPHPRYRAIQRIMLERVVTRLNEHHLKCSIDPDRSLVSAVYMFRHVAYTPTSLLSWLNPVDHTLYPLLRTAATTASPFEHVGCADLQRPVTGGSKNNSWVDVLQAYALVRLSSRTP